MNRTCPQPVCMHISLCFLHDLPEGRDYDYLCTSKYFTHECLLVLIRKIKVSASMREDLVAWISHQPTVLSEVHYPSDVEAEE